MTIAAVEKLCTQIPWCEPAALQSTVELALEIAREGTEGRRIGTLFTVGQAEAVLAASRALILDPLADLELTRRLRIHARTATVPVIVLNDVSRPQDAELALKAGANIVLERPVWADVLRQRIAHLLLAAAPRANRRRRMDSK